MKPVRLAVFGAPQVSRDGQDLRFDTRKAVALLAYLAVTGRAHRRDALAALLWPTSDQARARSALRRTLSVAGSVGPCLVTSRDVVELDLDLLSCDAREFDELVARGDAPSLQAAVGLASGDFLAGFSLRDSPAFDDWQAS
ncbi:MAG TPA: cyclase, partial [Actinomycetes bacterium]|nr:cyclase [Actinomycetes bacterium]